MSVVLPENPDTSIAEVGRAIFIFINTGTALSPDWTILGGQKSSPIAIESDDINLDNKTNDGWGRDAYGITHWSIDLTSLTILSDAAFQVLEYAAMHKKQVQIKKTYSDGSSQIGWATVPSFSIDDSFDGAAELKGTLKGFGPLSDREPTISPTLANGDKSDPVDIAFAITPTTTTVSAVKIDGSALTITTDYTYSAGALNIESTVIGALTIGNHTLAVTTGDGATLTATIAVAA